jgi:hypothetical protein
MKESYGEGLASRAGSESCGHGRKAGYEAYDHHVPFGRESVIRVRETVQSIDKITNLRSSKVARARVNKSGQCDGGNILIGLYRRILRRRG